MAEEGDDLEGRLSSGLQLKHPSTIFNSFSVFLLILSAYTTLVVLLTKANISSSHLNRLRHCFNFVAAGLAGFLALGFGLTLLTSKEFSYCTSIPSIEWWLYFNLLNRYFQLVETPLSLLTGKSVSKFHVVHHVAMAFTSFLWSRSDLAVSSLLAFVNLIDNTIVYAGYFMEEDKEVQTWKKHIAHWTEIETAVAYCFGIKYLWNSYYQGCSGWRVFIVSVIVHGLIGAYINIDRKQRAQRTFAETRAPRTKPRKFVFIWGFVWAFFWFSSTVSYLLARASDARQIPFTPVLFGLFGGILGARVSFT